MLKTKNVITLFCLFLFLGATSFAKECVIEKKNQSRLKHHQKKLENIASLNDGNRASGTSGYEKSKNYIVCKLKKARYNITVQEFEFPFFAENSDPKFEQISPESVIYPPSSDESFYTMIFSAAGSVEGLIEPVDVTIPAAEKANTSTSGCEATDFDSFTSGRIALIQRGACYFSDKVRNAQDAGAVAVIIFNEGQEGRTDAISGTLGPNSDIIVPVIFTTHEIGKALYESYISGKEVKVKINIDVTNEIRVTQNILAETKQGCDKTKVILGGHLDSVLDGPGINDNGSGVSAILEAALQTQYMNYWPIKNKICYAFWGGEELGLLGSVHYVENLTEEEKNNIAMYLNFDMIGSSNFVRFVYDGDGSEDSPAGPEGSREIAQFFLDYFKWKGYAAETTIFSGRSDYAPFMFVDIPVGGLFTGADEIKSEEQAEKYGGTAGEPLDPNYHTINDNVANNNFVVEAQMFGAILHAVRCYAFTEIQKPDIAERFNLKTQKKSIDFDRVGPFFQK